MKSTSAKVHRWYYQVWQKSTWGGRHHFCSFLISNNLHNLHISLGCAHDRRARGAIVGERRVRSRGRRWRGWTWGRWWAQIFSNTILLHVKYQVCWFEGLVLSTWEQAHPPPSQPPEGVVNIVFITSSVISYMCHHSSMLRTSMNFFLFSHRWFFCPGFQYFLHHRRTWLD